jgi:TctA family transporter
MMMATRQQIAEAVNDEDWQTFRRSLKGQPTNAKLRMLHTYWLVTALSGKHNVDVMLRVPGTDCAICTRVDNYLKALARGGQLHAGVNLRMAINQKFELDIKK